MASKIKLDPAKLLGFKLMEGASHNPGQRCSAKIGTPKPGSVTKLGAKIGGAKPPMPATKLGPKIGIIKP